MKHSWAARELGTWHCAPFSRVFHQLALAMTLVLLPGAVLALPILSGRSPTDGARVKSDDLAKLLNNTLDRDTQRLLILTQCYGGSTALSFIGQANTAVISGTSSGGQTGVRGGYDKGAGAALKPGAGTAAQIVHNAGIASKDKNEAPSTKGGIMPQNYSLENITATSTVKSRTYLCMPANRTRATIRATLLSVTSSRRILPASPTRR